MNTVRYFKEQIVRRAAMRFLGSSPARIAFWAKLNKIGARNIKSQPPGTVPDIDETVVLSNKEIKDLTDEFERLL